MCILINCVISVELEAASAKGVPSTSRTNPMCPTDQWSREPDKPSSTYTHVHPRASQNKQQKRQAKKNQSRARRAEIQIAAKGASHSLRPQGNSSARSGKSPPSPSAAIRGSFGFHFPGLLLAGVMVLSSWFFFLLSG
jgi:hypothetical protein